MRTLNTVATVLLVCSAVACGSALPPKELVDARTAYDHAAKGAAAQYDPTGVHSAENALNRAEQAYQERGDSPEARDLAYVALRRAQTAEARGEAVRAVQQVQLTSAEIEKAREQQLEQAQAEVQRQRQMLEQERIRREDAERRAQETAAALQRIATVKQEPRGMVITVPGNVVFAMGKSDILPGALTKLARVAESIKKDPSAKVLVQTYATAGPSEEKNQELSQRRADAISAFLASKGVPQDRIRAQGMGSSNQIADNTTPEGRTMNRRVEIVVQTEQPPESGGPTGAPPEGQPPQQIQPQPQPQQAPGQPEHPHPHMQRMPPR